MNVHVFAASRARSVTFVLLVAMLVGGHGRVAIGDESHGGATGAEAVELDYACGNTFIITNSGPDPVTVTARVAGAKERVYARLKPAPFENPEFSEVQFQTRNKGTVELLRNGERLSKRENLGYPCIGTETTTARASASAAEVLAAESAEIGEWSAVFAWPNVAVHLHLLPKGQVLAWGASGGPQLWNPQTGVFTPAPSADNLFCAGHAFLTDGRLLIAGGHIATGRGLPDVNTYTLSTGFVAGRPMQRGRWYPSVTTMGNGEAVIIAGRDQSGTVAPIPEVWGSGRLRQLTGASQGFPYYPRAFLAPNGKLFYAGELQMTRYLDVTGAGSWTNVGARKFANRSYGSAVMYEPGKILYAGGGRTTNTAEVIDLNAATPSWRYTAPMAFARRHHNLTLLPNGEVLATSGVAGTAFDDLSRPVRAAEIWTPSTGTWRTVGSGAVTRGYHATALLLPDGRVLVSGSGDGVSGTPRQRNAEIYSPPYLFAGARPTITGAPTTAKYGTTIRVNSPDAAAITEVSLIRLGSVTHAFDNNQRFQRLDFTQDANGLSVAIPVDRNMTPPGHYMLFILDGSGVPSVAKVIQIT